MPIDIKQMKASMMTTDVSSSGIIAQQVDTLLGVNNGQVSIGRGESYTTAQPHYPNTLSFHSPKGTVSVNLETGDLTLPVGVSKSEGLKEFWDGFHKHFRPSDKAEHEREIAKMEAKLKDMERWCEEQIRTVTNNIADKVKEKYGKDKFIMIKPNDLIKLIGGE